MPDLDHSSASLRVFGDDLIPEVVTKLLGCEPTEAWARGYISASGHVRQRGAWLLRAPRAQPGDFEQQVHFLLSKASSELDAWKELAKKYEVDLFCGWFMRTSNDGVSVSVETLRALSEREIRLSLDIYDASEDA